MLYCPPNVSFTVIWFNGGFSPCFVETVTAIFLGAYMLIFGSMELWFYWRYGTPIDSSLLRPRPKLYILQLICSVLLVFIPFIWLALRAWQHNQFYGYGIFYNVIGFYVWLLSLMLIVLERSCDLPSTPGQGHSMLLNTFWGAALALDSLNFVNFNGEAWYFIVHNEKDRALLAAFIVKWVLELVIFILGMVAPGMISVDARTQFFYRPLGEARNLKYGSTSSVETNLGSGVNDDLLAASVDRLREKLYNSELVLEFRDIPRQHSDVSVATAQTDQNAGKNRYCNVLPYDFNRVSLRRTTGSGTITDYINASLIVLKLPSDPIGAIGEKEARFIATQGPVPHTVNDFWQMIWEQRSQVIVMLTDLAEGGMTKCHQYWPNLHESIQVSSRFLVSCLRSEEDKSNPVVTIREFSMIDSITRAELDIVQLQYRGWPDFGAPKKPQAFLDFIQLVRDSAPDSFSGKTGPVVTHCSAGIGRTGVYILVDTLIQLIDRQLPIDPLVIIKQLRSQRMGMIQTVEQLVFACESGLKYYERKKK